LAGRGFRFRLFWIAFSILIAIFLTSPLWLGYVGTLLENSEAPRKADAALVLAGDGYGDRMRTGAELARQGFVPKVYVSGPEGFYGLHEDDLAIQWAVKAGYPTSYFVPLPLPRNATSTQAEAATVIPRLRRDEIRSLILVTSDFHTGRAGKIFRHAAPDLRITIVAAPDALFELRRWWRSREGRKAVFYEWTKTLSERVGL
jgi:uncharacterized SAM-binding protein YcdF (DUF218 family)